MKNLNSLIILIKKLSIEEKKSLLKFLKYYSDKGTFSKSYKLVLIILNSNNIKSTDIQNAIYGKMNNVAFCKLVDRLKEKILETLIFNSNISKKKYPERVRVIFDLKKKLIQCDILSLKGLRDDGDQLCRKIISKAEKFELYDILMNALIMRQRFINIRKNKSILNKIQQEIQLAENKYKAILNTQLIYSSIINKINSSTDYTSYLKELKEGINKIENVHEIYKSDIIKYYLNYLKTELFQINEQYFDANECLLKINLLLKNKSIYSENRMGTTLLNISNNNIHLNKFPEAIEYAKNASKYFPDNIFNQLLVNEYLFYSFYYQNNYTESSSIINKLINSPKANNISSSIEKWNYMSSILDFKAGNYISCLNKLNLIKEIDKDKEGWNINKRIIIIMCRIELKQYESADLQIGSLEKFIKRSLRRRDVRLRYIYILRLFIKLISSNYNFNNVYLSRKKYFQKLESDDSNLKWRIKSPELIKIDDWFKSHRIL